MKARDAAMRTSISTVIAGSVLAAHAVVLTLLLNPGLDLLREGPALLVSLFLPWAALVTACLGALVVLASLFRWWPVAAVGPIPRLPWFTTLSLVATAIALALLDHNLASYRSAIPEPSVAALERARTALMASGATLGVAGLAALLGSRRRAWPAPVAILAAAGGVVVPLALVPRPRVAPEPVLLATEAAAPVRRVVLVGIDGLSPALLEQGLRDDSLPDFARLMRRGAWGALTTLRPTEGPPLWTSVFTGRLPRSHGVKSFTTYRLLGSDTAYELLPKEAFVSQLERVGLVSRAPVTGASRRGPALWTALNGFGIKVGLVRLWGSHPPEPVQGFMLSNYFHLLRDRPERVATTLHPNDLLAEARARGVDPDHVDAALLSEFIEPGSDGDAADLRSHEAVVRRALADDLTYARAGEMLRAAYDPALFAVYFHGLDVVSHAFLRYARPGSFGDVGSDDVRRYGRTLTSYAAFLGREIARFERGLGPDDTLIVVSTYGIEPTPFWRRTLGSLVGRGSSASHVDAPDGVVLAIGSGIGSGARVQRATVLDLAPTILYLMGLPVARDMEGRVLSELLDERLVRSRPVTFIPSYGSLAVTQGLPAPESDLPPLPDE